jgi:hypothetical protein
MSNEQLYLSLLLCLLIWFVQIIHYPFFYFIDEKNFSRAMNIHQQKISYITMPLMIAELALSIYELYTGIKYSLILLLLVVFIWGHTFLIMVPIHKKLILRKDEKLITKLINNNWARTILWSVKLIFVIQFQR